MGNTGFVRSVRARSTVALVICGVAALVAAAPASAGTLDQQQETSLQPVYFGGQVGGVGGQVFTAGLTGDLDQVEVEISWLKACSATIEIRAVSGDPALPTNTILASEVVEVAGPSAASFRSFVFSDPATVVAGTQYAILLSSATDNCGDIWEQKDDPYTRGHEVYLDTDGVDTWGSVAAWDWAFRTYVVVDTDPPETRITKRPPDRLDANEAKFRFTADEAGARFECKTDRKPFKPCTSPKVVKRLDDGEHTFKVRATDAAGNVDPTPAKDRFKVVD